MASYSTLIRRIIFLLLLIAQDRVASTSLGGDITVDTNLTLNGSPYIVSQDLVVAENTTLAIQPGVQLHFKAGVALQVKGSLQAKGNSRERIVFTKTPVNIYNDGIRLRDGNSYRDGRLEIFLRGQWITACDDRWDMRNAEVACRQLGFLGAKTYYRHGGGTGHTWLNDVHCHGTEMSLLECKHRTGIGYWNCDHEQDIGVECYSLANWKGIEFSSSEKPSSLQYVDVSLAYEAIKGSELLPDLDHVTVKSSVYGVMSANASSPLAIKDSVISDNVLAGILIRDRSKGITIENTVVSNTINGHGLRYNGVAPDPVNFCSDDVDNITTFPVIFEALGKARMTVDCAKTIRTHPGQLLTVYYQSMTGENFELDVRDGNNKNASQLKFVNESTGVNQAVTPSSSSGHELYIRFRYSAGYREARVKFLITDDRDAPSLVISNCTFRDNHKKGVSLIDFSGNTVVDTTTVIRNRGGGMTAERIFGTLTATKSHFINNTANGLEILDSSFLSCNLHELSARENEGNGSYFQHVAPLNSNVCKSAFIGNAHNGFAIANSAGQVEFRNITAVLNKYSGVRIHDGRVSSSFESCNFSSNKEDGCCISNQAGAHQFFNCTANSNLRHGVSFFDPQGSSSSPRHFFKQISLTDNKINENTQYGFKLAPEGHHTSDSANVTIVITKNQFMRNSRGGIFLSPDYYWWRKPRRVQASFTDNHFEQNKVNAFHVFCVYLEAVIESNRFINNTDKVLVLMDNNQCDSNQRRDPNVNPVKVEINENIFMKNRAENILFIDYSSFPETRSAIVKNNTFEDNEVATKDPFPNFYRRSTTRAVIILKEGSFTLRENILENPKFVYQLSTLRQDYQQSIDAKFNWWGTAEECKIVDRIFDFQHRVELSPVEFFPYLLSSNKTRSINPSIPRPSCFLKGARIGGIVDRPLALSSKDSPYEVQDDIIILTNGSLSIPKNVTLQFPSRSAMVVQGTLLVDGTEKEKVRFLKKQHRGGFRLGGGAGPWEGRVEFLVNDTWWPLCLPPNSSFTSEAKIICQQLDLYYQTYTIHSPPGQDTGFVRNVVCDGNATGDIMNCPANTWSYESTCLGNTVHVHCQHYNWAGLHLAMTNHQSSLRHLEIHDAGYDRHSDVGSDIQIPGAALKVDLFHHNISNVFINNSVGIGVQVAYHSLFHNQSLMPHSTVSNTKSHGVLSMSPSLSLTDMKITRNDGSGFVYTSYWDKINFVAAEMASADVNKTLRVCSENKTFLRANKVFYFSLEALERSSHLRCHHVMETEPGYKIVIQNLYYTSPSRNSGRDFLHVYDGANASIGSPWKMESLPWKDSYFYKQLVQFLFNSTKSRVVFDLNKRAWAYLTTNFIVYTVKVSEQLHYISGAINIDRVNITSSLQEGVLIGGNSLKSVSITNTDIINTKEFGIKITPWEIDIVKIVSTNLQQNLKGIAIPQMSSTKLTIENCAINGSVLEGVDIDNEGNSAIRIVNSSVTYNGYLGVSISDHKSLTLFVSGSTFSWNKYGAIYYYRFLMLSVKGDYPTVLFKSNYFFRNQRIAVDIRTKGSWVFLNNTFEENRGISVISFHKFGRFDSDKWTSPLVAHSNLFLANECPDKAVINIGKNVKRNDVIIRNNNFTSNLGRCVLLEGTVPFLPAHIPISITDNLFNENYCENNSVVEILHLDENATLANNIFTQNRAENVVFVQVTHDIEATIHREKVAFNNNTLSNNIAFISSHLSTADDSCALVLSGIYKKTDFSFNKFNNPSYQRELCVRFPATSLSDVVNVTHNWWGTSIGSEVRDRISDFDDNYDFAIADDWPFLLSGDDPTSTTLQQHDFKQHGKVLSGRLFDSITLKASQSPHSVTSDLTVLDNVTLTIEAGVTVKVSPGLSILVAGALKAHGTLDKPVIFTIKEPASSNKDSLLPVRLVHGDFPWEGRAEVFHNRSWKPMSASTNIHMRNITEVVCKQLGYGPPVATVVSTDAFSQNANGSQPVEFLCHGNETFLHECPRMRHALDSSSMIDVVAKCQGKPWGNLRFVSSNDVNASQVQSVLNHVQFSHCGNRHGMAVPAVEVVRNVPKLGSITIRNCSSGGLQIYSPRTDVHLKNSTFVHTGGVGISFVQTRRNIFVESSESSRNQRGIAFEEVSAQNVPRVHFGRVFLCSEKKALFVKNQLHLYFDIPRPKSTSIACQKVLTVARGQGMKLTVVHYTGEQRLTIYDSINTTKAIVDEWNDNIADLVHKELVIPRDAILVRWSGDVNSEIVILVEAININDAPCTYELDLCGWQTFTNMSINGINVTRTWKITTYVGFSVDDISDYSYYSLKGKWLYVGNDHLPYVGGRAAIISPPITKQSKLCSIVFFYRVGNKDKAGLSLYIQIGTFPAIEQRLIWRAKYIGWGWKKAVVELPNDLDEYRLLLEGEYKSFQPPPSYPRNHVTIDNLELRGCSVEGEHRISNSVFSDNIHQAINYTSVTDESNRRPSFTLERCKIIDTAASASNVSQKSAISLDIQDNSFTFANNFISGNRLGGIQARLGRSDGTSFPRSLIYSNTFFGNVNGTILVQKRTEIESHFSSVYIMHNIFESNLGYGSTMKLSEVQSEIVNNFFYNNSGLHTIEYNFSSTRPKEQKCELNTFYLNKGLGQNYGVTIVSNGPMEYHSNNLKNPSNLYEFSSTREVVSPYWFSSTSRSDPIDATLNWWGVEKDSSVASRIYDRKDDWRWAAVEYKPFLKLPQRNILSTGCPAGWLNVKSTCFVFRGGSRTFKEAKDYCQYYGGHLASTYIPEDTEFINMAIPASRSDGKPRVPIWIATEENMVEGKSGERCTVITKDSVQKVVPCNSLYPFVCTTTARFCYHCVPNTNMDPPVLCDKPVDYTTVNCSHNAPCFTTTVMTSTNKPVYVLGCAEAILSDSSAANCSQTEEQVCSDVTARLESDSQLITSCLSECCTTSKCNGKDLGTTTVSTESVTPSATASTKDFAIQCYECTNLPEVSGGTECDSDGKINCPKSYDRCMTMKYTMSLGQSGLVSVEHRSCSNDPSCDPKNQLFSCTVMNVTGMLAGCSLDCCHGDLCNMPRDQESTTKPNKPPKATNTVFGLAASFGTTLLVLVLTMLCMCSP